MPNISNTNPTSANLVPKFASATSITNTDIYVSPGNTYIGIGTTIPISGIKLDVAGAIQMGGFKLTNSPTDGYVLTSDATGNGTWKAPGIGGSGISNFLPKFTGATTVGNSVMSETGGNIGIGTTTPAAKLDVNGTARIGGTVSAPGVSVDGTGNVGVGTATPTQKLDVNGNINITGSVQALQTMLALNGLIGRSSSATTPAGVFDNTAGGKILSGQVAGLEKFSVDTSGNVTASGTAQVTGFKLPTGASNGYVLTSDPGGNAIWLPPPGGGAINGTVNAIPKFTDPVTLGDSLVYEANSNVGIGTATPQESLTLVQDSNVATEMQIPSNISHSFKTIGGLPADDYYFMLTASDGVGWTKATAEILVVLGSSDHSIILYWAAVVGAINYRVYRALSPGGPYKYIETSATNFDYTNDGLFTITGTPPTVTTAYVNKLSSSGDSWFLGGNVGIGTTNPQAKLDVNGNLRVHAIVGGQLDERGSFYIDAQPTGNAQAVYINYNQGTGGLMVCNGSQGSGPVYASSYNIGSSRETKTDITSSPYGLSEILKLNTVKFRYKDDDSRKEHIGLIAEEVAPIIPEIVSNTTMEDRERLGIDYSKLTSVLIEAVKSQQQQIDELKDMVKSLLTNRG